MTQPGDRYRVGVEIGGTFADLICPGRRGRDTGSLGTT